jgi:hypothetical protein
MITTMKNIVFLTLIIFSVVSFSCTSNTESAEDFSDSLINENSTDSVENFNGNNKEGEMENEFYLEYQDDPELSRMRNEMNAYEEEMKNAQEEEAKAKKVHYCKVCDKVISGKGYSISNGEIIAGRLSAGDQLYGELFAAASGLSTAGKFDNTGDYCTRECAIEAFGW